jgi:hypothetical protein
MNDPTAFVCPECGLEEPRELLSTTPPSGALVICNGCASAWRAHSPTADRLLVEPAGNWIPKHVDQGEHYTVTESALINYLDGFRVRSVGELVGEFRMYRSSSSAGVLTFDDWLELRAAALSRESAEETEERLARGSAMIAEKLFGATDGDGA